MTDPLEVREKKTAAKIAAYETRKAQSPKWLKTPYLTDFEKFQEHNKAREMWKQIRNKNHREDYPDQFCVYGLLDPSTREMFYIGVTERKQERRKNHALARTNANVQPALKKRLQGFKDAGTTSLFIVLEKLENVDSKYVREKVWIEYFKALGMSLLNTERRGTKHGSQKPYKRRKTKQYIRKFSF